MIDPKDASNVIYHAVMQPDFYRDPSGWTMPSGRPQASWLRHVEAYLRDGYGGPGVWLGDGPTEAEGVPLQGGSGVALLRRMPPYLT